MIDASLDLYRTCAETEINFARNVAFNIIAIQHNDPPLHLVFCSLLCFLLLLQNVVVSLPKVVVGSISSDIMIHPLNIRL